MNNHDREYFTLVFKGDITKIQGNPMKIETIYGMPVASGVGNAFEKLNKIDEIADAAERVLDLISFFPPKRHTISGSDAADDDE